MAGSLPAVTGKPNTWQLQVYLGRDSAGQVRHRHAQRELAGLIAELESRPLPAPTSRPTNASHP